MKRFRNVPKGAYVIPHEARCNACGEPRRFFRTQHDPQRDKRGHRKHLYCFFCKRVRLHTPLGEVTSGMAWRPE